MGWTITMNNTRNNPTSSRAGMRVIGFNVGHLMLHGLESGIDPTNIYTVYMESYLEHNEHAQCNDTLLSRVVNATMLYRLTHPEAKYSLRTFSKEKIEKFCEEKILVL
jgi:phosphoglucomutase